MSVRLQSPLGAVVDVPDGMVGAAVARGYKPVSGATGAEFETTAKPDDSLASAATAGLTSAASGATLGLSDAAIAGLGTKGTADYVAAARENHPILSGVTGALGAIAPALLTGGATAEESAASLLAAPGRLASRAGGAVAEAFGGGIKGVIAGSATEGAIYGAGTGVSELSLSHDPVTWDRATSVLSSNMLYGGAIGGVAGALGKVAEKGLIRAKTAIEEAAVASRSGIPAELASLDKAGLAAREESALGEIKVARKAQSSALAEDIGAFRNELQEQKLFLATKDADVKGIGEIKKMSKVSLDADRQIDRLLNKGTENLGENLKPALGALQQQENALTKIYKSEPELRTAFAADTSGARIDALNAMPNAIKRNRELQGRIRELMTEASSPQLTAIREAQEALKAAPAAKSMPEQMLSGAVFGGVSHAIGGLVPGVGHVAGAMLGSKAATLATDLVFGRMGKATAEIAARSARAIDSFVSVARKAAPAAPVLATKVLGHVRYAPSIEREPGASAGKQDLASVYKARSAEIRSQTAYGPDGRPVMRPEARQAMASRLAPIRTVSPIAADRMESIAARRLEFLASKLPRRPDLGMPIGPDHWQPPDMEMRKFARFAAAVEDPGGVEERVAAGTVTPEDAEAYHTVYPDRAQAYRQALLSRLPELRASLPYQRRLALSIFSGVPVDPAMHPAILRVLQGQFDEPGTQGGTQAPAASPQFGSVKKSVSAPTPAESRSQGPQ